MKFTNTSEEERCIVYTVGNKLVGSFKIPSNENATPSYPVYPTSSVLRILRVIIID